MVGSLEWDWDELLAHFTLIAPIFVVVVVKFVNFVCVFVHWVYLKRLSDWYDYCIDNLYYIRELMSLNRCFILLSFQLVFFFFIKMTL